MPYPLLFRISALPDSFGQGTTYPPGARRLARYRSLGDPIELADVQGWMDEYVTAWRNCDAQLIAALFTEDATYGYDPWEEPVRGREAIVAGWLEEPDEPDSWQAEYRPMLVDGNRAIVTGETRYTDGKVYSNLFVIEFDDGGRCRDFIEWYMRHPKKRGTAIAEAT